MGLHVIRLRSCGYAEVAEGTTHSAGSLFIRGSVPVGRRLLEAFASTERQSKMP
jgi:hypothetical protein